MIPFPSGQDGREVSSAAPEINVAGDGNTNTRLAVAAAAARHRTACFSCRSARQRCDRLDPCSRCAAQKQPCSYPSVSHRGRKPGSSNKPDTVEKFLLRISESPVGDQVVKAILDSAAAASFPAPSTQPGAPNDLIPRVSESAAREHVSLPDGPCSPRCSHASEPKAQPPTVAPLDILAAAVTAVSRDSDIDSAHQTLASPSQSPPYSCRDLVRSPVGPASVDRPFVGYFGPQSAMLQKDWQVLSTQSVESIFKLESSACDPVAARLIDETDANYLFNLFFTVRNPLLGLLDPELHTPEYVYASSFTLFSAICCLGCAVSSRPRDRVIHAALLSLAEANMKWSIAVSARGLEIIQAIVLMQYWAPMRTRHSSDPSWLHLSHAAQLARELAIYNPDRVDNYLAESIPTSADDVKERFRRNFERTWLCIFIADQSFGVVNGRRLCVSWNEMPPGAFHWWQKPMTSPYDRIVSGIVETRGILLNALEEWRDRDTTQLSVSSWHTRWFETLEHVRGVRCAPDALPSSVYLPLLAFYMDHGILVLNAQATRELAILDADATSLQPRAVSYKTAKVATRTLHIVLTDPVLSDLRLGFHNNQFIMICHAVAEVVDAIKKNILPPHEAAEAALQVRAIPDHLDKTAQQLPATSVARLYASLSRCLVLQLNKDVAPLGERDESTGIGLQDSSSAAWWSWEGLPGSARPDGVVPTSSEVEQLMLSMGWNLTGGPDGNNFMFLQ